MGTLTNSEDPDEMPHNVASHHGSILFVKCNCEDAEPDVPQEAVKPGTALDCSQFEETQVAAFDNDEYFTTRKSDIIYAVEVQEAKFESFHRENSKHYSTITDLEASKPQRLSAPVISTNVSERVPIPHRNSAPQLLQEHSPSGFFQPKDNVILEAPPPEHIFVQNVSPQHSLSEPQLAERGGLEGADPPDRAPRPHVNKWKRTSQQTRTLPPLPPRHYLRGADRLHRNVLHVRPPSDSFDQIQTERKKFVASIDFGTACSGWAYSLTEDVLADPDNITVKRWISGSITSYKTRTSVLLSPDGSSVKAFGCDAEKKYAMLVKDGRNKNYYLFSRFKVELHKLINKGTKHMELLDITGRRLPAKQVLALMIGWLKDDIIADMRRQYSVPVDVKDIHWIITVPAVYSRTTKQFMSESAGQAGIPPERLTMILEADAAVIYSQYEAEVQGHYNLRKPGAQYIIIDAAGETVDIVAIEVDRANSPKKISMAYARHLGGMKVTTGFERLLKDIFGAGAFKKFAENHLGHFIELMQEFEKLKRSLQVDSEESVTVTIPTPLIEIYQTKTAKKLEDNKVLKHLGMTASENKLVFTAVVINELFKEQCEDIVKQVSRFLEKDKLTNVSAVVMVGGFSESVILQQTIKQSFPYLKIIVAKDSSLCVLKGAVMHGQIQV